MASTAQTIIADVPECPRGSRVIEDYVARVGRAGLTADMATLAVQASRSPRTEVRMMGALCCSHVESGDTAFLRPRTARSPFRAQPALAVALLAPLHRDVDKSTRLSAAHALANISKKHPAIVREVISGWDIADPRIAAVVRHAARHL